MIAAIKMPQYKLSSPLADLFIEGDNQIKPRYRKYGEFFRAKYLRPLEILRDVPEDCFNHISEFIQIGDALDEYLIINLT